MKDSDIARKGNTTDAGPRATNRGLIQPPSPIDCTVGPAGEEEK